MMKSELSASEALFGFAGWLTSMEKPVIASANHDAAIWAELVQEYVEANDLSEPREKWDDKLKWPKTRKTFG